MKYLVCIIALCFSSIVWAHKSVKVQSLDEATKKFTESITAFTPTTIPKDLLFLKTLKQARGQGLDLFQFVVKADWGPIHGLVVVQSGKVIGVEILSFTEHAGNGVTKAAFLSQFKGITKTSRLTAIKPLPKEPKTSQALLEVIKIVLSEN